MSEKIPPPVAKSPSADPRAQSLLEVARGIIRETGNFDLPMRSLAARAQVSLRTPYEIFGSKNGIIRALLEADQEAFRLVAERHRSGDQLEMFFDRTQLATDFYATEQSFYRALFRSTQAYSGGNETEPAREMLWLYEAMVRRAVAKGFIREELSTTAIAETLTDLFAANMRNWASGDADIQLAGKRICFGFALALAGVATPAAIDRLRERAKHYDLAIQSYLKAIAANVQEGQVEPAFTRNKASG